MKREGLGRFGPRGRSVTVFVEDGGVWLRRPVKGGGRKVERFGADTPAGRRKALRWARDYGETRAGEHFDALYAGGTLTLRGLWERYQKAHASGWRPKTARVYAEYQSAIEDVFQPSRRVAGITLDDVDEFRVRRRADGIAHSQVRRQIGFLRQLLNFAEGREWIPRNKLHAYRYVIAKEEREPAPAEYSRAALNAIWDALQGPRHWRARGIVTLCGSLGARINAVLHLCWADVDFEGEAVTWRREYDKLGDETMQPLTPKAKAALLEAWQHRHESEPWVFWAVRAKGRPYHYNSVHHHLHEAEKRADVPHIPNRAFHGLRRMVVGDMGDLGLAATWVRQKSLKVTAGYDRARSEAMEQARARMTEREASA